MKIYLRGVVLSVSEPETVGQNGMKVQHCVIQHEFGQYQKWATFEVLGEERIKQMALKPQEEVELAIDINARMGSAGRWFNSLTAYAVERDKTKYHYYQDNRQRVAVMPTAGENERMKECKNEDVDTHANAMGPAAGTTPMPTKEEDEVPF